jgi:hypothetical protein
LFCGGTKRVLAGNECSSCSGLESGVTLFVFNLLAEASRGIRSKFVLERFFWVKFGFFNGMEEITGEGAPLGGGNWG